MSEFSQALDNAFNELRGGFKPEWKKHTPARAKLSKKEDVAFVRKQRQRLFEQKRAIDRQDFVCLNGK